LIGLGKIVSRIDATHDELTKEIAEKLGKNKGDVSRADFEAFFGGKITAPQDSTNIEEPASPSSSLALAEKAEQASERIEAVQSPKVERVAAPIQRDYIKTDSGEEYIACVHGAFDVDVLETWPEVKLRKTAPMKCPFLTNNPTMTDEYLNHEFCGKDRKGTTCASLQRYERYLIAENAGRLTLEKSRQQIKAQKEKTTENRPALEGEAGNTWHSPDGSASWKDITRAAWDKR
jgi:hypothetical protein